MSTSSKATINHSEIRRWVEERGGQPVTIVDTQHGGEEAGVLRIDFPGGASNPPLEPLTWDAFFEKFDQERLAMIYQDKSAAGTRSYFNKFVDREQLTDESLLEDSRATARM